MRLWWEVARRGFRRYATYRWATFAGVFTNSVFGFMRAYILLTLYAGAATIAEVATYTRAESLTYSFVTQGLIMPLYLWGWYELSDTVYSGQVVTDLYRPYDYQLYWLSQDLGRALYHLLLRGVPPVIVAAFVFDLRFPRDIATWPLFVVSVGLAVTVSFALRFMVNLAAFWIIQIRGLQTVVSSAWTVFSGFVMPIAFFPRGLHDVMHALPFAAMVQLPMDVFLERADIGTTLGTQLFWALALLMMGRVMLGAATRKLVVQGG
jgi:ABC-2 type transport system permease protein